MTTLEKQIRAILFFHGIHGLGKRRLSRLIDHYGDITEIPFEDVESIQKISELKDISINPPKKEQEQAISDALKKHDIRILTRNSEDYPQRLFPLHHRPEFLFIKGEILPEDEQSIAIVGTRNPSEYGYQVTVRFAESLARSGVTIVSGLASGVDSLAHKAALRTGGRTVAVLGNGIDITYPAENKKLYEEIPKRGAIVSEYLPGTIPDRHHFPGRNRIISALSLGTLVTCAPSKSGSLITADFALEQGKNVYSVPGSIFDGNHAGCNKLIKEGASPVTDPDDILSDFGIEIAKGNVDQVEVKAKLPDKQKQIFDVLSRKPMHIDIITKRTGIPTHEVMAELTNMLIAGYIEQRPGKQYIRLM